jgi:amino acid adenylation domain-containing protein
MPDAYPDHCIHELFERQAARQCNALAISFRGVQVSFGELNQRANRVAHYLIRQGLGPEALVGVFMERSVESVTALIGILKAGAAWVHLDPAWPDARRCQIIEDCKPALILNEQDTFGAEQDTNPAIPVSLGALSYLIYTSGSTGKPKAVMAVHRSMTSRLAAAPLPDMRPGDICCLNSSHSFGISTSRLLLPLAQGIPVVILAEEDVRDVVRFVAALEAYEVTSIFVVPAVLRQMLAMEEQAATRLRKLRAVAVSGGALTIEIARAFFQLLPQAILVNVYGGSELGTAASLSVMRAQSPPQRITLGYPAPNTKIRIIDGEICVSSRHLARGYLNDAALTAGRFVPDPAEPGTRMYRTGDLGRILENGETEFAGRADHQVKIRGFRIELGEIEAALHAQPGVLEAAAATHEAGEGEKRLVAYVVPRPGADADVSRLRKQLKLRLPDYMIPSSLMLVSELPRTDNGKINRMALPAPSPHRPPVDTVYVPAASATEQQIVNIWEAVLKVSPVGVHDHFLDLGGDSLTATELIARVWQTFEIQLNFRSVFDQPTVAHQACLVDEIRRGTPDKTDLTVADFAKAPANEQAAHRPDSLHTARPPG